MDDELVDDLIGRPEGLSLEFKELGDLSRKVETLVAFANTNGGILVLGVVDERRASGRDRVVGVGNDPTAVDELSRMMAMRITPPLAPPACAVPSVVDIRCTLKDGTQGSIVAFLVKKSSAVHSLVNGGTFVRVGRTNRQISAAEITELSMKRGVKSAVASLAPVAFELLDTNAWREYREKRRLTRDTADAMFHLGLARRDEEGGLRPTLAAVLLFAEEPSGLLDRKCSIRSTTRETGSSTSRNQTS